MTHPLQFTAIQKKDDKLFAAVIDPLDFESTAKLVEVPQSALIFGKSLYHCLFDFLFDPGKIVYQYKNVRLTRLLDDGIKMTFPAVNRAVCFAALVALHRLEESHHARKYHGLDLVDMGGNDLALKRNAPITEWLNVPQKSKPVYRKTNRIPQRSKL